MRGELWALMVKVKTNSNKTVPTIQTFKQEPPASGRHCSVWDRRCGAGFERIKLCKRHGIVYYEQKGEERGKDDVRRH